MKPILNPEQLTSIVRGALSLALAPGSFLVLKGILPADQAQQLIVPLTTAITVGGGYLLTKWGVMSHSAPAVVAAVNSDSVPGVKAVAATSASPDVAVTKTGAVVAAG